MNEPLSGDAAILYESKPGPVGPNGAGGAPGLRGEHGRNGVLPPELKEFFPPYKRTWELAVQSPSSLTYYPDPQTGDRQYAAAEKAGTLPPELRTIPARWGRYLLIYNLGTSAAADLDRHPLVRLRGIAAGSHLQKILETARLKYRNISNGTPSDSPRAPPLPTRPCRPKPSSRRMNE